MSSPSKSSQESKKREKDLQASSREKAKMYSGFQARTIRSFWEQHNQQPDIDISPEIFSRLAEDATYKIWEVINSVKTYTKHSGGCVTSEITNDVLKDTNCEPIVGSNDHEWGQIDDVGVFYFLEDKSVDLHEEYTKEKILNENMPLSLDVFWYLDEKIEEDKGELFNLFYNNMIRAIFVGDLTCFNRVLRIVSVSPHIVGFLRHFLNKWIDLIAFDYTNNILDRCLQFLEALIRNPCTVDSHMNRELKYLCQLLVSLLAGPDIEDNQEDHHQEYPDTLDPAYLYMTGDIHKEEPFEHDSNSFMGMNGMSMNTYDFNSQENFITPAPESHTEDNLELVDNTTANFSEKCDEDFPNDLLNYKLPTKMCDDEYVDQICKVLGMCSVKWGGVESLCSYLLINKVENFFATNKAEISSRDYEWLQRIIRGLWSLGEFAFRDFLIYFEKIDTTSFYCPESFTNYLNFTAIFMRGKNDIFFYEYIQDTVGDKILPFLLYYPNFLLKLDKKYYKQHMRSLKSEFHYYFPQKIKLSVLNRLILSQAPLTKANQLLKAFPLSQSSLTKANTSIRFECRQIYPKKTKNSAKEQVKQKVVQNEQMLKSFNRKIVIARKKLIKPATNRIEYRRMHNYHFLTL